MCTLQVLHTLTYVDCLGGSLSLGIVTRLAVSYSRVTEGCYLEENGLGKKEEAMLSLSQPPFIRVLVAAYIAPG